MATGSISQIKLPNGSTYDLKDAGLRNQTGILSSDGVNVAGVSESYFRPTIKVFDADPVRIDLSVVRLSADDYDELVANDEALSNVIYVVDDAKINAYDEQIKNLAAGVDDTDAVNMAQFNAVSARIDDTYTKAETDQKIASAQYFKKYVVQTLPPVAEADERGIYLVPSDDQQTSNTYDEYVIVGEGSSREWEKIGSKSIDLSGYKTKQTAKTSPTASGTTTAFIDTISQDENGVITATKKNIQSATTQQAGIVQLNNTLTSTATNQAATANVVKLTNDKFADYSLISHVHDQYLTAVPSDYKTYSETQQTLSGDGYATQDQLNEKSTVSVDNVKADVNLQHISQKDYEQLVVDDATLSNALYVVSADYVESYGQQIKNVAPGSDLSDAVNVEQLLSAVGNVQVPTDLSSFNNSPGYLVSSDISDYYQKSETSSAIQIAVAIDSIRNMISSAMTSTYEYAQHEIGEQ